MSSNPIRIVVVLGPTAVGKTSFMEHCTTLPLEVINSDAMQVYCLMDIGTAKPSKEFCRQVPHHLLDICYPDEQFNVGDFVELTNQLVQDIRSRGKTPIIVGGSGFYLWHFLYGLPQTPRISDEIRAQVKEMLISQSKAEIWRWLQSIDPVTARKISPHDNYRISRALEVYLESGMPLSSFPIPRTPRKDVAVIGLHRERDQLKQRIIQRCEIMFQEGLSDEIQMLMNRGYTITDPGIRAIGYREFWQEFSDYYGVHKKLPSDVSILKPQIVAHSYAYMKRQYTYFSRLPMVQWYEADRQQEIREAVMEHVDI